MGLLLSARRATLAVVTAFAFMLLLAMPAMAHHKTGHEGGPAASTEVAEVTEDNDSDGVVNAPDPLGDSDNRHPSGKDKHAEAGGSGNQGKSSSEPDGNGKGPERDEGGLDKPNGPGGLDILDQDGNNGCGNDDDFEDDNEGNCLGPATSHGRPEEEDDTVVDETDETVEETDDTQVTVVDDSTPTEVQGDAIQTASQPAPLEGVLGNAVGGAAPQAEAVSAVNAEAGELAFTGLDAITLLLMAMALAGLGWLSLHVGRRARS